MFDLTYRFNPSSRHGTDCPSCAADALTRLEDGNRHFSKMLDEALAAEEKGILHTRVIEVDADDLGIPGTDGKAAIQRPFAAVLGCSDARVPIEMVLNQTANRLFVIRVAGNVLGTEPLGSLDFAITAMAESVKVILVLGHSGCGAVTAAVDSFITPSKYLGMAASFTLRTVIDRIMPAVRLAHWGLRETHGPELESEPGYRAALIEASVVMNAALNAGAVRKEFGDRLGSDIEVVFGVYNLITRRVKATLEADTNLAVRLSAPPTEPGGYEQLATLVGGSGTVSELLKGSA